MGAKPLPAEAVRLVGRVAGSLIVRIPPGWVLPGSYVRLYRKGATEILIHVEIP